MRERENYINFWKIQVPHSSEPIVDEKDSGFFQKDHTIHQCFDWLVFKIFYKSVIFSKITAFFYLNIEPSEKYLDLV